MVSRSEHVRDMTDESSARSHRGCRTVSRGLLGAIYESLPPAFSNEMKGTPVSIC
ncbi:unnamed protein product [Protopolystoma xenopodis]|uniref:Uncharacterized protein n=1 Tax=Protopolystoma xenopodis TaxID=117903 RepID=A0A448WTE8_9PLAT|nr:unnamed protein product [Protopolystoma xenopodis]